MILKYEEFRDKMTGCWVGKNVAEFLVLRLSVHVPYRMWIFNIQDLTMGPPANDDLDLQIVWLAAVERYGRNVNASIWANTGFPM